MLLPLLIIRYGHYSEFSTAVGGAARRDKLQPICEDSRSLPFPGQEPRHLLLLHHQEPGSERTPGRRVQPVPAFETDTEPLSRRGAHDV